MSIDFSSMIDVRIAIILWCLGWILKHSKIKFIKNLSKESIPVILIATGVVISCIEVGDVTTNSIIIGIVTSVFAVGVHSSGKNIFKLSEGTTVFATQDNISNNLAKQEKEKNNNSIASITDDFSDMGSMGDLSDVSDYESLSDGETIIGNSVG